MHFALVLGICCVAGAADPSALDVEVDAAARAYRIESYNRHREDRTEYRTLRQHDDELHRALSVGDDATRKARRQESIAWYREATSAMHVGGELPAMPVWMEGALAEADRIDADRKRSRERFVESTPSPSVPSPSALPPSLSPAKPAASIEANVSADASDPFGLDGFAPKTLATEPISGASKKSSSNSDEEDESSTPFAFVNAALRAIGGAEASKNDDSHESDEFDVREPVIDPPGPIVDEVAPIAEVDEPAMDLPKMELPTLELPTLSAEDSDDDASN